MAVDLLGLFIFLLGVGLIVLELALPGYFIGVGGTTLVVLGLLQMAWDGFLGSWWSPFAAAIVVPLAIWASILFYKKFAPPSGRPETFSSDRLVNERGLVTVEVVPNKTTGKVKVAGIVWSAESEVVIPAGTWVVVRRVDGVHLVVEPAAASSPSAPVEATNP